MHIRTVKYSVILLLVVLAALFRGTIRDKIDVIMPEEAVAGETHDQSGSQSPALEKKIKHWVAPMDPTYIRDKPGKSPMGMDLVPVYEEDEEDPVEGVIKIDPVTVQNIGVRTARATKGTLSRDIRTVGQITYDEKRVEHVHTKVSGWIDKLYVDTTGEEVKKDQPLLSLYSPDLVATQEEYIQALKFRDRTSVSPFPDVAKSGSSLAEAARKRLLFMDIHPSEIEELEKSGEVKKNMKIFAPKGGTVIAKNVLEGMRVEPMMELYTIADLSHVWAIASVYEYELPLLKTGQEAEVTLPYDPGVKYRGKVTFIYPYLSSKTRTVQVRMEFDNPDLKLKPDMYADVFIKVGTGKAAVLVPSESVLRTGSRSVVITSLGEGRFLPREVTTGGEGEGMVQVLSGLEEGDTVVTSGQFLIDSESNLREAVSKMIAVRAPASDKEKTGDAKALKIKVSAAQKKELSSLMEHYLKIHNALVQEAADMAAEESRALSVTLERLMSGDPQGELKDITGPVQESLEGLMSGDIAKARDSFKLMSRAMVGFVKGPGRDEAVSSGIKLYYCPMADERWLQKEGDLQNPYLGKDMLICGSEEKI